MPAMQMPAMPAPAMPAPAMPAPAMPAPAMPGVSGTTAGTDSYVQVRPVPDTSKYMTRMPMYPAMGPGELSIPMDPQGLAKLIQLNGGKAPCCFK